MKSTSGVLPGAVTTLAGLVGSGSLLLFGVFLVSGAPRPIALAGTARERLLVDALLCALFFAQHSGMVRPRAKKMIAGWVSPVYVGAAYSVASGAVLTGLVLLWQPTGRVLYELHGPAHWLMRLAALGAVAGFAWAARSLGAFDPFGAEAIRAAAPGRTVPPSEFVARGPYRFVRHPLYLFTLVLMWSTPRLTADRLLFNSLTTGWIVLGTWLEERDLVREFGDAYRRYQRAVPMLVPLPRRLPPA